MTIVNVSIDLRRDDGKGELVQCEFDGKTKRLSTDVSLYPKELNLVNSLVNDIMEFTRIEQGRR